MDATIRIFWFGAVCAWMGIGFQYGLCPALIGFGVTIMVFALVKAAANGFRA